MPIKFILASLFSLVFFQKAFTFNELPPVEEQVVSGVILKNDTLAFDTKLFLKNLKGSWGLDVEGVSESDGTLVFSVGSASVMIAANKNPYPSLELAAPAGISWLWKTARTEALNNRSHLVISVVGEAGQPIFLHRIFTKIAAAALASCNASGVFMSAQYLLVPRDYYLESARNMSDESLPVYLWVYFGLMPSPGQNGGYTYGLREFGLPELEISGSGRPMTEVHAVMYDVAAFLIFKNKRLERKEMLKVGDDLEVEMEPAAGTFLEEKVLKIRY